jgi:uncharacterized membrane protein YraQ (UPF0718 family)
MKVRDKKGFILSLALMLLIAIVFWTQSRFPALDEKSQMGQRASISALAFDVIYPLSLEQSHLQRISYSAVNWAYTNWKGMTFGLLFAAAVLVCLSFVVFHTGGPHTRKPPNHFLDAFKGSLFGLPLGVCANCSTPVAFGLYRGGTPLAAALAMLSSSPTFNIVVLTMSLTLLPLEMVVSKYLAVAIYLWLVMPSLVRLSHTGKSFKLIERSERTDAVCLVMPSTGWLNALSQVCRSYVVNLWQVVKGTLPFMVLAGVLAVIVAEFVDLESLNEVLTSSNWSWQALLSVAVLAAFFPVPIAFDVVISVGLLAMGVSPIYVGVAFFALGIFSIYPAMMIARDISTRLSLFLTLAVILLALGVGLLSEQLSAYQNGQQSEAISELQTSGKAQDVVLSQTIDLYESRNLVRQAAKLCNQLDLAKQQSCFERFVINILSTQFSSDSCQYLEDALDYRRTCDRAYHYLAVSLLARETEQLAVCESLTSQHSKACQYDLAFELSMTNQDLTPCLSLKDEHSKRQCVNESLAINFELFESNDLCQALSSQSERLSCKGTLEKLGQEKTLFQQNSLKVCQSLEDQQQSQYCQGVVMVNQLEQGASLRLCEEVKGAFLQQRCRTFYRYFQIIENEQLLACRDLKDSTIAGRCELAVIFKRLTTLLDKIRYDFLLAIDGNQTKIEPVSLVGQQKNTVQVQQQSTFASVVFTDFSYENSVVSESINAAAVKVTVAAIKFEQQSQLDRTHPPPGSQVVENRFQRVAAAEVGLLPTPGLKMTELFEPFSYGRGISSGDFDQDLWPDLAIAFADHVRLYKNTGGQFSLHTELSFGNKLSPVLLALVDMNNDGLLDLFVSFYGGQNRIYLNRNGQFDVGRFVPLSPAKTQLVMSAAFQDMDSDGDVDIVLGGWSFGDLRHFNPVKSQNHYAENLFDSASSLLKEPNLAFELKAIDGVDGESLSVLISDIDANRSPELLVGNDMDGPDAIYRWSGASFKLVRPDDKSLPTVSSFNTMSIDSGDLNRDLKLDYFSADMAFGDDEGYRYCQLPGIRDQAECERLLISEQALHDGRVAWCQTLLEQATLTEPTKTVQDCLHAQIIQLAKESRQPEFCEKIASSDSNDRALCVAASMKLPPKKSISTLDYMKSEQKNVLMLSSSAGFVSSAGQWHAARSHWSWNAKIADLDNDGWQDIYVGNGYLFGGLGRHLHSNTFFRNAEGKRFEQVEEGYGLSDYLNTPSFTYIDIDLDGDLDIVSNRVAADHGVFINHTQYNSIRFSLHDRLGGRSTIGSKVFITYGTQEAERQMKELKLGGGFLSFDEPVAHFGLAAEQIVSKVIIEWSDGLQTELQGEFLAGRHYQVSRH